MPKHTITWTVLPTGSAGGELIFSVLASPRLVTDVPDGSLGQFPDWLDWPTTLAGMSFALEFPGLAQTFPAVPVPGPDSVRWRAMFTPSTYVLGHTIVGFDHIKIRSYPMKNIVTFLQDRYGRFGVQSPTAHPTYDALVAGNAYGPIGFENTNARGGLTGPARKVALVKQVESQFNTGPGSGPGTWAIPYTPVSLGNADDVARTFLQHEQFIKRGLTPRSSPRAPLTPPQIDFHQMLSLAMDYPRLLRMLGIVLDFRVPAPLLASGQFHNNVTVRIVPTWTPQMGTAATVDVSPLTHVGVGKDLFAAIPRNGFDTDYSSRHLKVGDQTRFAVAAVDPDGAAIKSAQFADNVTRSRIASTPRNAFSAATFALPALRSAGMAVARVGHATRVAQALSTMTSLNTTAFTAAQDPTGVAPDVFVEDITRGTRWDVYDVANDVWFNLMGRQLTYAFSTLPVDKTVTVVEEGTQVIAPGTASTDPTDPGDLYLQESLMRWTGWSLAVPRLGSTVQPDDTLGQVFPGTNAFNFEGKELTVPPAVPGQNWLLPRLRFGRSYKLRARAVDLAGNSVAFEKGAAATDPVLVTQAVTYQRFEPVPAPRVLLAKPHTPGESNEWAVIRSETGADPAPSQTDRHVVPPKTSQLMAEHHGMLDQLVFGRPMDKAAYASIAQLDKGNLENNPDAQHEALPTTGSFFYDVPEVIVNYLPDPFAKSAIVEGLPGSPIPADVPFLPSGGAWPAFRAFRIHLQGGVTAGWSIGQQGGSNVLTVTLAPGDIVHTKMSSRMGTGDRDQMGLWPWLQQWAATQSPPVDITGLANVIDEGRHWMFTPGQPFTLVHAVRTPLVKPTYLTFLCGRLPGQTSAGFSRLFGISRTSMSKLDIYGAWPMAIDKGPGDPGDPTVEHPFEALGFTLPIDRDAVSEVPDQLMFSAAHEFGDTKFRRVTYTTVATSSFVEYFREEVPVTLVGTTPVVLAAPFEGAAVKVIDPATGSIFLPAPPEGVDDNPALGDYIADEVAGTVQRTQFGNIPDGATVTFSFVQPEITTTSDPLDVVVPSSARPAPPKVLYVVPTFGWTDPGVLPSVRTGGGLRVYLDRPWWSSGDEERLGVVLWQGPTSIFQNDPPAAVAPYVTMWGIDPVYKSQPTPLNPNQASFPLATATQQGVTLGELPATTLVDVAGHDVHFDATRDLWYCDIQVTDNGAELKSYLPFIRLALVRYQPNSLANCHLSKVVLADFMQLSPTRSVSVVAKDVYRYVTVTGRAYTGDKAYPGRPSIMQVTLESAVPGVTDDLLRWQSLPVSTPTQLSWSFVDTNMGQWTGKVTVPGTGGPYRLVIEEFEQHKQGPEDITGAAPQGTRLVHTDIIAL